MFRSALRPSRGRRGLHGRPSDPFKGHLRSGSRPSWAAWEPFGPFMGLFRVVSGRFRGGKSLGDAEPGAIPGYIIIGEGIYKWHVRAQAHTKKNAADRGFE